MRWFLAFLSCVVALAVVAPAAGDRPTAFPFEDVFEDVNPCTGLSMTVTFSGTEYIHFHDSRVVGRGDRTITTSDGFVGRGTHSFVDNGRVLVFRLTDILSNAAGDRIRARSVFVLDLATGSVRVDKGELTCLGP
jgi:hypothetical protein